MGTGREECIFRREHLDSTHPFSLCVGAFKNSLSSKENSFYGIFSGNFSGGKNMATSTELLLVRMTPSIYFIRNAEVINANS